MLVLCYLKHPWTFCLVDKFHSTAARLKLAPRKEVLKHKKAVYQLRQNTWHHIKNPDTSNPPPLPNPIKAEQFMQPLQTDDETRDSLRWQTPSHLRSQRSACQFLVGKQQF